MNNNYSSQRHLNIRVHSVLDKKYDNESASSDSDFSDGYDRRLDDDFNAMLKQTRMKKVVKKEPLREEVDMPTNEPFLEVMKHEYGQAEMTENGRSDEAAMANELNLPDLEMFLRNVSSSNMDISADQIVNNEKIIAEVSKLHESAMGVEVSAVFNGAEGSPEFFCNDSLPIEEEENTFDSVFHSTARKSMMSTEKEFEDSNWTDYESDMTEGNFTENN